jgi:large subunit ribosomal protein L17
MRHRHKGRKLNRTWSHRKAMLRNMVTTFLDLEQIETTDAKAKEVRSLAERLITLGKRGGDDLAARRQALKVIRSKKVVAKLFDELGPRFADRPGGYTRIVKVENRRGDGAHLSILQMVNEPVNFKDMKHKRARLEEEARLREEAERKVEKPAEAAEEVETAEGAAVAAVAADAVADEVPAEEATDAEAAPESTSDEEPEAPAEKPAEELAESEGEEAEEPVEEEPEKKED